MRLIAPIALSLCFVAPASFAQNQMAQPGPQNPAVKSANQNNANTPVAGANSFTMSQAQARIQARGYTNVSQLTQDSNGIWRGTATKDGQSVPVSVDYQGNVN
jgi:hypothetical protein